VAKFSKAEISHPVPRNQQKTLDQAGQLTQSKGHLVPDEPSQSAGKLKPEPAKKEAPSESPFKLQNQTLFVSPREITFGGSKLPGILMPNGNHEGILRDKDIRQQGKATFFPSRSARGAVKHHSVQIVNEEEKGGQPRSESKLSKHQESTGGASPSAAKNNYKETLMLSLAKLEPQQEAFLSNITDSIIKQRQLQATIKALNQSQAMHFGQEKPSPHKNLAPSHLNSTSAGANSIIKHEDIRKPNEAVHISKTPIFKKEKVNQQAVEIKVISDPYLQA